ncbi:MAG: CehA/McbA family metallohydrolase, partial [Planctomycetota bacterium]|nr:CehA/McbA family metallohydrolase [Planctomycetota bacterium]
MINKRFVWYLARRLSGSSFLLLLGAAASAQDALPREGIVLQPFMPGEVRVAMPIPVPVLIYNPFEGEEPIHLEHIAVTVDGVLIGEEFLDEELAGGREYGELQALLERLPHEVTHSHRSRRYFAGESEPEFVGLAVMEKQAEFHGRRAALVGARDRGRADSHIEREVIVPLDQVFLPSEARGTVASLGFTLSYRRGNGERAQATCDQAITWIGAAGQLPSGLTSLGSGSSVHFGDMHVHSCYGEVFNACGDGSCPAESTQISGSFSYAQLKGQYLSLGMDWFTATDHSYCINSAAEYSAIESDCQAITSAAFICLPDMELSSDEAGDQVGLDAADGLCVLANGWPTQANHMGAHGINRRIVGGHDWVGGFCDDPPFYDALEDFRVNIDEIRSQGGYPVAHHPVGTYGWNSYEEALGIEANALHGVEIWNSHVDGSQAGQGGNVGRWVDWLLDGRILYAYAGSDTHDEANGGTIIGYNAAVLADEPFTPDNLEDALRGGRVYVTNGPALALEADLGAETLFMGARRPVSSATPTTALTLRVAYDFNSAAAGSVTIYGGRSGDSSETTLSHNAGLGGSGVLTLPVTLVTDRTSWYRAYIQTDDGAKAAYTNPIFFVSSFLNDYCGNAQSIAGQGSFNFDTRTATQDGEAHALCLASNNDNIDRDVWFEWTPDATGTATVETCSGATGDTKIAAYEGAGCPTGAPLACNDDECAGLASRISFPVVAGNAYALRIGTFPGAAGEAGSFEVAIDGAPCVENTYCTSQPNSTGATATLDWSGSCLVSDNNFTLHMDQGTANQPGLFIYSAGQNANPFGDGVLCVGGQILRLGPPSFSDGTGSMSKTVDLSAPPSAAGEITDGSTWNFQAWYRDSAAGGAGYNLSNAFEITFAPGPYGEMALVPAGSFEMGRHVGNGYSDELPVHPVNLDAFYMDIHEVTILEFANYLNNALARGEVTVNGNGAVVQVGVGGKVVCDTNASDGVSHLLWDGTSFSADPSHPVMGSWADHPMVKISWYGACAYANGKSRDAGLDPCYDESDWSCDFTKNGYRLP